MAVDVRKRLETVFAELSPAELAEFSRQFCQQIEQDTLDHKARLPEDVSAKLGISDFYGERISGLHALFKRIPDAPEGDYGKELDELLKGIEEPSELMDYTALGGYVNTALQRMSDKLTPEKNRKLDSDNFLTETTRAKLYFDQNQDMETFFGGRDTLTEDEKEQLKKDTAAERADYAKKLGDQLVAAFADVKEGDDVTDKFNRMEDYFRYSEKYNVGLKLKEDPNNYDYRDMGARVYFATQDLYTGKPGTEEKPIVTEINWRNIFTGDRKELEARLRREAEEIAAGDTFMYFKDKIDNLPEYVRTGDPQLLDENSALRFIDNVKKDVQQEIREAYGNDHVTYDADAPSPDENEIADQLFEEYKKAGEIGDRLQYYSEVTAALQLPLATPDAEEAMKKFTDMVIDYECRDKGEPSKEKIQNFAKSIAVRQADLAVQRGQYNSAKEHYSGAEVQSGLFAQNFGAMGLMINETMCDKMGLPPFASMIKEYHILYARQELSKDKEKKAGFARAVYDQSLQHKPVEEAINKSASSKSKNVSELRMIQAAGASGVMKNHRNYFLGQREIDKIDGILENMEKTGDGYFGHTNTDAYNTMKSDLKTYRDTLEKINNNPLLATEAELDTLRELKSNMTGSAKAYLSDKHGMRWHDSGTERQNAALGILSVFDRKAAKEFETAANDRRWFKKINLEELENKLAAQGKLKQQERPGRASRVSDAAQNRESIRRSRTMTGEETGKNTEKNTIRRSNTFG